MSIRSMFSPSLAVSSSMLALASSALGQCLSWKPGFTYAPPGVSTESGNYGSISAMTSFDDGSGAALYVGGTFVRAGELPATNIAKWDGTHWSAIGPIASTVTSIAVFDDGSGPTLYAARRYAGGGDYFSQVLRWSGQVWFPLPDVFNGEVHALSVFDDGSGSALYVGGEFTSVGSTMARRVARWNGSSWSPVGGGVGGGSGTLGAYAFQVFDDGTGSALYAGGHFNEAEGSPASNIAKWNGSAWTPLGSGVSGEIYDMTPFDDGTGLALCVGGTMTSAGGIAAHHVAKWNGAQWAPIGTGFQGLPCCARSLGVFDAGSGPQLYAGGYFTLSSGGGRIARWNGTNWVGVGGGVAQSPGGGGGSVDCFVNFDAGNGPRLIAGGVFAVAGSRSVLSIASWSGSAWSALQAANGNGLAQSVSALAAFNGGTQMELYAGGYIHDAGGTATSGIAKWNGSSWSPVGGGVHNSQSGSFVYGAALALTVFTGPANFAVLYVGGNFTYPGLGFAMWDGANWSAPSGGVQVFGGLPGDVYAFAADDFGATPALFVGGAFNVAGGVPADCIARFEPIGLHWSALGSGMNADVYALATFDDGSGLALYAAGAFTTAGGVPALRVAKWNPTGSSWSPVGGGFDNNVLALKTFDDGSGNALYAGGGFTTAGGAPASLIARWNGSTWSPVGAGLQGGAVFALSVFDDGGGSALYAGGGFLSAGGTQTRSMAKWDGSSWSPLGNGLNGNARAIGGFDLGLGSGSQLFVGGEFTTAGAISASHVAQWRRCDTPIDSFCFGDGSVAVCPCGNSGLNGHGCENSAGTGGARLYATGTTQPDTVVLHSVAELPNALSIFLQGDALEPGTARFGDGLRCAAGQLKRLYVKQAVSGATFAPDAGDLSITARSAQLGDPIAPGATRYYQTYYRDPSLVFCPSPQGDTWNVTNGAIVVW